MSAAVSDANQGAVNSALNAHGREGVAGLDAAQIEEKYSKEREKRLNEKGNDQYVEPILAERFQHFLDDPWADPSKVRDLRDIFPQDNKGQRRSSILLHGAGWSGLIFAIELVKAGVFRPDEIFIVDTAAGFGGTWYWNRYPGLMCDTESYIYLPYLEETGYMPRYKYAYGYEIREYMELLAEHYGLTNSCVWQTKLCSLEWNEDAKEWTAELQQQLSKDAKSEPQRMTVHSQFVHTGCGPLHWPKLPGAPGILDYKGETFHSARWNYDVTGGTQSNPELTKLKDKRVAIVGTGASAIQSIPHLAKWAKHLYVVQRTPSGVDVRGQRPTDPETYKAEIANHPGWQLERNLNFNRFFTSGKQPSINLVNDRWADIPGMTAMIGDPEGPKSMNEVPAYIKRVREKDHKRQAAVRAYTAEVVKDPNTAEKLQAWYPSWCKRPCFHDDYLQTYNRDNVTLLDTNGKGLDKVTADSIVVDGKEYPVDIIIFATGFRAPAAGGPAEALCTTIRGRDGANMDEAWAEGPQTLHGTVDYRFPNLLLATVRQIGFAPNYTVVAAQSARNATHVVKQAKILAAQQQQQAGYRRKDSGIAEGGLAGMAKEDKEVPRFAIAPTKEAVDAWGDAVGARALASATMGGCTPGYMNLEAAFDALPEEVRARFARTGVWGAGYESYKAEVDAWQADGQLRGMQIRV